MRLAFVTHEPFYPPSGGGSAEAVYLVETFRKRGWQIDVFCPDFPQVDSVSDKMGVTFHPFRLWRMGRYTRARNVKYLAYPWFLRRNVRRAVQLSREVGPPIDVLLAQHTISAVSIAPFQRELGLPVILNYLDFLTGFMETWPSKLLQKTLVPVLNRLEISLPRRHQVQGVMTVSDALAERLIDRGYPKERIQPIYYGYDSALFTPTDSLAPAEPFSRAPSLEPGKSQRAAPVVVMHGSFDQHHLGAIAKIAFQRVHARRSDVIFRLVGTVTEGLSRFVDEVRRVSPGIQIELPGFVPYHSVASLLRSATLGIVPYEASQGTHCAFVAKAVEYLGCGLPVVSTSLENLTRYFADEPAMTFAGFDPDTFADSICQWLDREPEERRAIGLKASARVAHTLDWSRITESAADFIQRNVVAN